MQRRRLLQTGLGSVLLSAWGRAEEPPNEKTAPKIPATLQKHPLLTIFEYRGGDPKSPTGASVLYLDGTRKPCPDCESGRIGPYNWGKAEIEILAHKATYYPDLIQGLYVVLVNQKVLDDMAEAKITGFIAHKAKIWRVSGPISKTPPPVYYLLEITGKFELDRKLYDEFEGKLCPTCHSWKPGGKYTWGDKVELPVLDTWNGGDWSKNNVGAATPYCSRRVVELARVKKWTGFRILATTYGLPVPDLTKDDWDAELTASVEKKFPLSK